jgi:uncharacterized phage infection (PIP) family protein YhgE
MKKIFITLFLLLFLVAGTLNAQTEDLPNAGMLPDNPLYFLETLSEGVVNLFTFGDIKKAERYLLLASERLVEAETLAEKGNTNKAKETAEKYQRRLDKALLSAKKAVTKGKNADAVLERIAEITIRHQENLAKVYERVPEQAKESIQKVMENSSKGHETALNAVSREKQKEVRDRVKKETKDVEDRLNKLRNRGIPIPEMNNKEEPIAS